MGEADPLQEGYRHSGIIRPIFRVAVRRFQIKPSPQARRSFPQPATPNPRPEESPSDLAPTKPHPYLSPTSPSPPSVSDLREQIQGSLGPSYTLDRELGGGGMSRVFVARDATLRRDIVVKVLPPELIAGVNVERFRREILVAAGLQHPHIVPVLASGEMDGVPWFTMPFVQGESLR